MQDENDRLWLNAVRLADLETLRSLVPEGTSPERLGKALFVCVEQWGCGDLEKVHKHHFELRFCSR